MTVMQVTSFMLRSFYEKKNIPFPTRLAGPQESSKLFREEKKVFHAQESKLYISVQSIASPLCFKSGTLYHGGKSLDPHRTGGSVGPTADLKAMAK